MDFFLRRLSPSFRIERDVNHLHQSIWMIPPSNKNEAEKIFNSVSLSSISRWLAFSGIKSTTRERWGNYRELNYKTNTNFTNILHTDDFNAILTLGQFFVCVCPDTLHQAKTFRNKNFFCFARDVYIVVIVVAIVDAVDYDHNDSRLKSTTHFTLVARINTFLPSLCTVHCCYLNTERCIMHMKMHL